MQDEEKTKNETDPTKKKTYQVKRKSVNKNRGQRHVSTNIHLLLNVLHIIENRMFNFKI